TRPAVVTDTGDYPRLPADKIGPQFRHSILPPFGPAEFNRHVAAFDVSGFPQAFAECLQAFDAILRRTASDKPDHRHCRLLRARRERPRGRRAAHERDELASLHSITSSASCWRCKGTSRPTALAVLRFIASMSFVGNSIGKSPGFAPFRILST